MFNTSLRRVARTCSNGSPAPSRPTTPTIASFTSHAHQRRHSSSKPPVPPNNGSSAIPPASVKQVGALRSETKRSGAESRLSKRRVSKDKVDAKQVPHDDWTSKLPSVPSLQHLNPKDIYVASFFSTHRPLSITGPVPQETSIEAIDKVFQPKPKSKLRNASQEVILTLSSTVERLDEQIAHKRVEDSSQHTEAKAAIMKALMQRNDTSSDPNRTHHLDGAPQTITVNGGNVKLVIQEIAKRFRPFNVPPAPVPISDAEISAAEAEAAAAEANEEMQAKSLEVEIENQEHDPYIQQVVLNVHEQGEAEDGGFFTSHTAPLMEIEEGSAGPEILDPRHKGRVGRPRHTGMYAISVKRQRRLKMKKHKYRKLMRKTRNIRRRLGQI
ncbi:hypothetical protein LTR10_013681 [Elasticomyces elasticus]|uniref:Small ribosomal subunit protein mS38 n=1 Tax=Exophiala sideris TaxID=1016849 RepID=A0ABR0JIP5_9EURO|nr:hypothetical protein LTR10_013681 [Elasticomyces elasticus]KAK5033344.1 hypothetical protein LTS07_003646 [Exophiala sideris]KAK5042159.1 hypothetical protein LTR13_001965 [Exophiala sideris]KAK5063888.1 hypothetical protein LTR69_003654 [Exophiala sideris]KAK5185427.1 hypothetical protein LTR44_002416 [Eurotiomycetes sp. CCFEE 6388]